MDMNGHDVVEYRSSFSRKMLILGFLNKDNAITPEAELRLSQDLESLSAEQINKIFYD